MIIFGITSLLVAGCATGKEFTYQNPIRKGIDEEGIRDAQIFQDDDGKYYLIGTCAPFWKGPKPGIRIYSGDSPLEWKDEGLLIDRSKLSPEGWYYDRFWAPEIIKIKDKYYLLFNCNNEQEGHEHGQAGAVAVADNILGPYKVLTHDKPFTGGNDLSFYEDDDGAVYAFWNGAKKMFAAKVDMEKMKPVDTRVIFTPDAGTWDAIGIEGPYCIKRNGTYYLFYSSWSRGYEIGYATANHPLGPWTKAPSNPIYGAQSESECKKNNLPYDADPNNPFRALGHNEVWTGPDGRLWISCHGILRDDKRPALVIDPINFDDEGNMTVDGPTWTPQSIKLK